MVPAHLVHTLLLLCIATAAPAQEPDSPWKDVASPAAEHGPLISHYRGCDRVLARTNQAALTEEGFYLWQLMHMADDALLVMKYRDARGDEERRELGQRIESVARDWAFSMSLSAGAAQDASAPGEKGLERMQLLLLVQPIHELVWIDRALRPQVEVLESDIVRHYEKHPELALGPESVQVRYLFFPVNAPEGADPRTDPRWAARREELRSNITRALVAGMSFTEMAERYSQAPSAANGGLVPPFQRGSYFREFEQRAFSLDQNTMSEIFEGPGGLYVLQVVEEPVAATLALSEVHDRIAADLELRQLSHRFAFEMERLRREMPAVNLAGAIDEIPADMKAFEIGRFELTRQDIWRMFPGFVGEDFALQKGWLIERLNVTADLERIARQNRRLRFLDDPRLAWTQETARRVRAAEQRFETLARPRVLEVADEATSMFLHQPEIFRDLWPPRFSMIEVRVRKPEAQNEAWLDGRLGELHKALEIACGKYGAPESVLRLARGGEGAPPPVGDPALLAPRAVERELRAQADRHIVVTRWFSERPADAGELQPQTARRIDEVRASLDSLIEQGKTFAEIETFPGGLRVFYVAQPDMTAEETIAMQRFRIHKRAVRWARDRLREKLALQAFADENFELLLPSLEETEPSTTPAGDGS